MGVRWWVLPRAVPGTASVLTPSPPPHEWGGGWGVRGSAAGRLTPIPPLRKRRGGWGRGIAGTGRQGRSHPRFAFAPGRLCPDVGKAKPTPLGRRGAWPLRRGAGGNGSGRLGASQVRWLSGEAVAMSDLLAGK